MFIYCILFMNKQKILAILKELKPNRELADWMIALIEAGFMDKETYQNTLFMIAAAIKQMPEWKEKSELQSKFSEIKNEKEKPNKQKK